jgi:hypothetical protein
MTTIMTTIIILVGETEDFLVPCLTGKNSEILCECSSRCASDVSLDSSADKMHHLTTYA